MIAAIVASWLPYFDIFNALIWIGPLPLPLAWTLSANVVLTVCAAALYPLYFKPLHERMNEHHNNQVENHE